MQSALALNSSAQNLRKNVLPRVGTIKDYEATGLTAGCNNFYFYFSRRPKTSNAAYVFISRAQGNDAWMNLNNRDVRIRQIHLSKQNKTPFRFSYRWRKISIGVVIEDFKPKEAFYDENDWMFKMKISLRRGRFVKVIRAVGDADC